MIHIAPCRVLLLLGLLLAVAQPALGAAKETDITGYGDFKLGQPASGFDFSGWEHKVNPH